MVQTFQNVQRIFRRILKDFLFQDVSTTLVPQSGSDFSVGTLHMARSYFVFFPLWICWLGLCMVMHGLHLILHVYCELPLFCLIWKQFEALSTSAQPTGHSPAAAGSTWQVKAVVFAAHLPSSLLPLGCSSNCFSVSQPSFAQ